MAMAWTRPLRRELPRALPSRPFAVEFWDGTAVPATEPDAPVFALRSPRALAHVLGAPGQLGVGRAYVAGDLEVPDLDAAMRVALEWEPPPIPVADRVRLALAAGAACGPRRPPPAPRAELRAAASGTAASATPRSSGTTTRCPTSSSRCSSTAR